MSNFRNKSFHSLFSGSKENSDYTISFVIVQEDLSCIGLDRSASKTGSQTRTR